MNYKKLQIRIFTLSWLSYAFYYVSRKNFSVVKSTLHEDLGFSMVQLGTIETLYAGSYMLGQFISGALGDKLGPRKLLTFGMFGSAITSIIMGLSVAYSIFAFSLVFNGLFQSTGWANNLKAMTPWFNQESRGKVTGFWCTCYTAGPIIATATATYLLVNYSWQTAFIIPGILVMAVGALVFFFLIDSPEKAGFESSEVTPSREINEKSKTPFMQMITHPTVIVYGIAYAFIKFVRYSFTFWLPWYLYERLGFSKGDSGYVSVAFEMGGFFGVIGIGVLSDKYFSKNRAKIVVICIMAMAGALYLYQLFGGADMLLNVLLLALIGFMLFGGDSVLSASATQDIGGKEATASAVGIVNGIGSLGGVCGGVIPALITQRFGWSALFYFLIFSTIFAGVLLSVCTQKKGTRIDRQN
ncbi:General substrate transporter [Lentisphaera araneosa HTCC2155]|uniref:General substrate transporter n=1 Tax=Lentisphaera araneosa HTCC2155 TaxID=313628 RepID=A6DHZ8_9BACT|nr:MFS transporter [Lentisphaera araneosa]EDM28652.1 General substrate transporter [Lentisphaera araneosa HTCC2155]